MYVTEVVVSNFSFLESTAQADAYRQQNGGGQGYAPQGQGYQANPYGTPAANQAQPGGFTTNNTSEAQPSADPFADNGDTIDIADNDLPF